MTQAVSTIAIFGQAHEVWPVAAILCQNLPKSISIIVAENHAEEIEAGVSLACENSFHKAIGITVEDLVLNANGTLGLGTDIRNWRGDGSRFFAAPSGTLPTLDGIALYQILLYAARLQGVPDQLAHFYESFRFAAQTALAGKFSMPSTDPDSPATMLGPVVQFDRLTYTALLKTRFGKAVKDLGKVKVAGVSQSSGDGILRAVQLDKGQEVTADFFVDVSGDLSHFLPETVDGSIETFSDILPFDQMISVRKNVTPEHNHTIARALTGGVLIETPLQQGAISELVFSSKFMDSHEAQSLLGSQAKHSNIRATYMTQPWVGNLARLGSASACFGPYHSADILFLNEQAVHLASFIPARHNMSIEATEFNRRQQTSAEQMRDFLSVLYFLNNRSEPVWDGIRNAQLPKSLQIRIDQFKNRGRFVRFDHEIFDEQLWIDLMIGFGLVPQRCDPMAVAKDKNHFLPGLTLLDRRFRTTIQDMPSYEDYLQAFIKTTPKA